MNGLRPKPKPLPQVSVTELFMEPQAAKNKQLQEYPDDGKMKFTKQERERARREVERMLAPMLTTKTKPSKGRKSAR